MGRVAGTTRQTVILTFNWIFENSAPEMGSENIPFELCPYDSLPEGGHNAIKLT
jgi:hypothetical protein